MTVRTSQEVLLSYVYRKAKEAETELMKLYISEEPFKRSVYTRHVKKTLRQIQYRMQKESYELRSAK